VFVVVRGNPKNLPKSGSGKVMWRLLQEAQNAGQL
jgi:acyl-coenzyme A synthetase/AMP-(fatty) acid ligase